MSMNKILITAAALIMSAGVSMADTTAAPAAKSAAKPVATAAVTSKPDKMAKMHKSHGLFAAKSEAGKACSAQADAKSLHGQPRREFRKSCLKGMSNTASIAPAAKPIKPVAAASAKPAPNASSTH